MNYTQKNVKELEHQRPSALSHRSRPLKYHEEGHPVQVISARPTYSPVMSSSTSELQVVPCICPHSPLKEQGRLLSPHTTQRTSRT